MFRVSRRTLMRAAAGLPALQAAAQTVPGKSPMMLHNEFPEDLEALPEYLDTWVTPVEHFFVRQHLPRPTVNRDAWTLEISGAVGQPVKLTLADLEKLPQHTVPATLECAGNGRGNFRPRMPGIQWTKGAIGNAEWRGPRVLDVLAKAVPKPEAAFGDFNGADLGVAKTPDFIRSIPLRKLRHEATILALQMNGQPVPEIHGGPVRLIVPGWDGASWVKWVQSIRLAPETDKGFYMATAYRYPKHPVPPGGAAKPEDMDVIEGMPVKSFFSKPAPMSKVAMGSPVPVTGAAWAGENRITRVEVSTDGGAKWTPAALSRQDFPFAWRTFRFDWKPLQPGFYTLCCRAFDSAGRAQPIEAPWNPSGYLYNSIERIGIVVEG